MTTGRTLITTISLFGLLLAPAAFAEQPMQPGKATDSTLTKPSEMKGQEARIVKASDIMGYSIKNAQGQEIGKIEDIVLNPQDGRVEYVAMSTGGFLGMGDKLFAIPWDALRPLPQQEAFSLDVSTEQIEKAQGFDKENWPKLAIHEFRTPTPSSSGQTPRRLEGSDMKSTPDHPSTHTPATPQK